MKIIETFFKIAGMCLVLSSAVACEDLFEGGEEKANPEIEINFSSAIEIKEGSATTTQEWVGGETVGVFMKKNAAELNDENILMSYSNRKYVVGDNGALAPADDQQTMIYQQDGGKVDFVAYSPYKADIGNYSFTIDVSDQSDAAKYNLLVSDNAKGKYKGKNVVGLKFRYTPAFLALNITKGKDVEDSDLQNLVITLEGTYRKAVYSLGGGFTNPESAGAITFTATADGSGATAVALPVQGQSSPQIRFVGGNIDYTYPIPQGQTFESGRKYTFGVTVSLKGITVTDPGVEDWEIDDEESGSAAY